MGFWTDTTGATPAQHSTITLWKITQTKNFWKINTFAHICTVDGHQQASDLFFVRGVWVRQRLLWRWHFPSSSDSSSCHIVRDSTKPCHDYFEKCEFGRVCLQRVYCQKWCEVHARLRGNCERPPPPHTSPIPVNPRTTLAQFCLPPSVYQYICQRCKSQSQF